MDKSECCAVIKYLQKKGMTPKAIHTDMVKTLGIHQICCSCQGMENDTIRNYQKVSKAVKDIPPTFARTAKTSKCGGGRGGGGHTKDSASVQQIDKVSAISSSDPLVTTTPANNTPPNRRSTVRVDEAVALGEMPCSKETASQQQSLHLHQKIDLSLMSNKTQKIFAKLPGLSNPLLQGLSSRDCDKASKTELSSLSFPNKGQSQQLKSLNYDVGRVFGDVCVTPSAGAESNQAVSNVKSPSNNLFFTASYSTLQVPEDMTGVCQSAPNKGSSSFADISHQSTGESIKNSFYDTSNTQNVNCKMILSGTGRETCTPLTRTPAQPATSDQSVSTGKSPKPNLPSTSNSYQTETNSRRSTVITDPERLALIKQRKRERKFRKLQSLSALMRAPDDRHSTVQQLNPLRRERIAQENFKRESVDYTSNSTGSAKLGDITQSPFNWMPSSVDTTAIVGAGTNFEKKPWRSDTVKKTCSFFHEPSLRNNSVLSENFSEISKYRADYKTEKKLNDPGSNSWQLHSANSYLDDHLLPSASGKLLDINSENKRILENFLTPRVKKEDSGSESSTSISSEEENSLSPKIKRLGGCKEKMWHRPESKFGGNMVKFKNEETDSSSLDHFHSALVNNYQKHTRDSADYKTPEVNSDKRIYGKDNNTSDDETDNDSDNNNNNNSDDDDDDDDDDKKSCATKLFGNAKRKNFKAGIKRRGRPPLSDKHKSQSHKIVKRRGRPPLMNNFGKSEVPNKSAIVELDMKPQLKVKDDTADNKMPRRRGRPPKKVAITSSPISVDTPIPPAAVALSLDASTSGDIDIPPASPSPSSDLTNEELLKARLNLPRRRGRPTKVDVMLREMAAARLAAGQSMALPSPEAMAAALAQTAELPAKKKKVYARRRYHAYGQRKRRRRKSTSLLRTLSTVAAEFDAGPEIEASSSELSRGTEGGSRVSGTPHSGTGGGGINLHQTAYNEEEEEEEEEDGEDMEEKAEVCGGVGVAYGDRSSTSAEALANKRHRTGHHHHHRRHHRHHHQHHQEQQKPEHQGHNDNNNVNDNNNNHRQLPLLSSSPLTLASSSNIVVSLSQLSHHAEPTGEEQPAEAPNAKRRQKKRKKDAGGERSVKKQRTSDVAGGTPGGGINNNNNNNSMKEVVKQEAEEEESVLVATGNTFRMKMMKSKPNSVPKGPASTDINVEGLKKEVGGEESSQAGQVAAKPKSKKKKTASSSFSSSSTKAGVIKISRNNTTTSNDNEDKSKINTTTAAPPVGNTARQIAPPVYNVPRVMLPPCIKDDGIACLMCGRVHTQDHFFKYMELKSTETSHRCPLCGQFFSWSCLFIEHMRSHPENTAQYRCEYCGSVSRKISSYFNCRITHCPPSQEWFDLQKACDDYLASLENKSSSAAAKKRRKAAAAAVSSSSPSAKKKGSAADGGGSSSGDGGGGGGSSGGGDSSGGGGGGRGRKKASAKQQEKDGVDASVEKAQSSPPLSQQQNSSSDGSSSVNNNNNKRKGQKQSKGRKSSTDTKASPSKPSKPYACNFCQKTFLNFKFFTKHKELHKTEAEHWCKECSKQFPDLTSFNAHKCSHHTTEGPMQRVSVGGEATSGGTVSVADNSCSSDNDFKCSLCGAIFPDAITHKCHVDLCDGLTDSKRLLGPHKCNVCERSFKLKQSLLNHMRRHTGERPFVCVLCDKSFMQAGNLERHLRTHERDTTIQSPVEEKNDGKLFTCEHCEKAFTVEAAYQSHLKVHENVGGEQFRCPYCDEHFPSRHLLKLHKRTHNEHRPFRCSTCSRCYKYKYSLLEHQRNCR